MPTKEKLADDSTELTAFDNRQTSDIQRAVNSFAFNGFRVNPESVTVKTDGNGEPLASEIARFRQETGTANFPISSQSEIDRVNRALGGMNRGPDERIASFQAVTPFSRARAYW